MAQPLKLCQAAADDANENLSQVGFAFTDILAIISAAFPVIKQLMSLCNPSPTPASTRKFVAKHYVARKSRYAPPFLHKVSEAMQDKAQGTPMENAETIYFDQLAISTLDKTRLGSDADIQEALSASE